MESYSILLGLKDKEAKPTRSNSASAQPESTPTPIPCGVKRRYIVPTPERAAVLQEVREEKRRKVAEAENRQRLIVGIDFGVTFSGVAYVATNIGSRDVTVIKQWSGGRRQNDLLSKVPSRFAYAAENKDLTEDCWGYQVQPGMKSYSWFKLLLDNDTDATEYDDPLLRESAAQGMMDLPLGKSAKDLTADFLARIYKHTQWFLGEIIGKGMVKETPCHYKLTLPAIWSLEARKITREAAELAGFGTRHYGEVSDKLTMIDEPEAAAICAIKSTLEGFPEKNPFEVGQGIIVADLGGGTVDLVSYRLAKLKPLQLEELCVGIGAKCGGTSIDRALHQLMRDRYGNAFSSLPVTKVGPGSKFMEDFETIKRDFDGEDSSQTFEISLKMRELDRNDRSIIQYDFGEDEVTLTSADMENLFKFTVDQSLQLVLEQTTLIKKKKAGTIKTIVLCGGLGSSPYVKNKFDHFCEEHFGGRIQVVRPVQPWVAVCSGAALQGLEVAPILSRRSRYYYGFIVHKAFEEDEHDEEDAFEDQVYGKRARNQMKWCVKKDEKLKPGVKREHKCTYTIPPNVRNYTGHEKFYLCMDDIAPARLSPNVQVGGEIIIHITTKLLAKVRRRLEGEGFDVKKKPIPLDVTLSLIMGSEKGVLEVKATSGRTKLGDAKLNYQANSGWKRMSAEDVTVEA